MKALFLDCEFVDNQEVIELSVFSLDGVEVYHRFFKPAKISRWPVSEKIHHISPDDVRNAPSFASCLPEIQKIFDEARYVVGFATGGDVAHLSKMGVKRLDRKRVIDIKQMFWLYVGRQREIDYYSVPGLGRCAELLDISFGEKGAHSASEDTLVTLKLFAALAAMIPDAPLTEMSEEAMEKGMESFEKDFKIEKERYERARAAGWIQIYGEEKGVYRILFKRTEPDDETPGLVAKVRVGDWSKAESDLIGRLQRKSLEGRKATYRLSKRDLDFILSYSNSFEDEETHALNRKLVQLQMRYK